MPALGPLILPITLVFLAIGLLAVLTPRLFRAGTKRHQTQHSAEMACSVCQQTLVIAPADLRPISGAEVALVVRECRSAEGRPLAGYACPYCDAYHVFALDGARPAWLVANPFEPQARANMCIECRKPLKRPSWPRGQFDGQVDAAPGLEPKHGLECSRCASVCCVECCRFVTRGKTEDGSLLCPRCFRGPVEKFHHF